MKSHCAGHRHPWQPHAGHNSVQSKLHSLQRYYIDIGVTHAPTLQTGREVIHTTFCSRISNMLHYPNKPSALNPLVPFANGTSPCPPSAQEQNDSRNPFTLDAEDASPSFHGCSRPSELSQPHGRLRLRISQPKDGGCTSIPPRLEQPEHQRRTRPGCEFTSTPYAFESELVSNMGYTFVVTRQTR
jgi:hypothetical protein